MVDFEKASVHICHEPKLEELCPPSSASQKPRECAHSVFPATIAGLPIPLPLSCIQLYP